MSPDDPRHGTSRGYAAHRRDGSEPCAPCRSGAAEYERWRHYDSHLGRERLIDTTGSRRRIRALQAIGWPARILAAELGYPRNRDALAALIYRSEFITRRRAMSIADVYDRLSMTNGPSSITRARAVRAGYAPPLAWNNIDDPNERPDLGGIDDQPDPVVVARILNHDATLARAATVAERRAVVAAWPESLAELERMTGWKADRYTSREDGAA